MEAENKTVKTIAIDSGRLCGAFSFAGIVGSRHGHAYENQSRGGLFLRLKAYIGSRQKNRRTFYGRRA